MNPDDAFERILASLYRAMIADAHWPGTSALIDEACGVGGSGLVVGEGSGGAARIHFARLLYRGEPRPDLAREYLDVHYPHDAGMRRLMGRPEGRLVHLPDLYTEDELKTSPVYNEGWRRLGARKGLSVHFDDADGLRLVWCIADPVGSGDWQPDRLRLIERLAPHVRQFVRVRQALAAADALGAGCGGPARQPPHRAWWSSTVAGGCWRRTAPALSLLRRGDGLVDRDGVLDARLPGDRRRLRGLLARALPRLWGKPPGGGSMTVERPSGGARLVLHVSPVGRGTADFGGRRVAALVLVVDPARRPRIDPVRVAQVLDLSPSQGRVAALLAEGRSVGEIAEVTGYTAGYVRWILKRIYNKQGVSGQVALVSRVLATDAPALTVRPGGRAALSPRLLSAPASRPYLPHGRDSCLPISQMGVILIFPYCG